MFNTVLFVMVAALFVHTFFNFFLKVYTGIVSKISGVAVAEHSVEEFFSKLFSGILGWFKKL